MRTTTRTKADLAEVKQLRDLTNQLGRDVLWLRRCVVALAALELVLEAIRWLA